MRKVALTFTALFFLATVCSIALADAVPGAVLYLDASDNPAHPKAWTNLGTAGGELPAATTAPKLEEGKIKIPGTGINENNVKYYTAKAARQTFGGPVNRNPELFLKDWTLEFLCKRNGSLFLEEHHFAGFQNSPREGAQGIRLWLLGGQNLDASINSGWVKGGHLLKISLDEGVWTWITIVSENKKSIVAYQDGEQTARSGGVDFDNRLPINDISIGANSFDERRRTFNGSFAIVRVYDKALTRTEVERNVRGAFLAVDPAEKLSTTWARVKNGF